MKVDLATLNPRAIQQLRGVVVFRDTKQGCVAQKWPKKVTKPRTLKQQAQQVRFAEAAIAAASPWPLDLMTALEWCKGTLQVPRDILTDCALGTHITYSSHPAYQAPDPVVADHVQSPVNSTISRDVALSLDAQSGDYLVTAVIHRSILAPPPGWTLLTTLDIQSSPTVRQTLQLFGKRASSSDAGKLETWRIATSGVLLVRNVDLFCLGVWSLVGSQAVTRSLVTTTANTVAVPPITAPLGRTMALLFATSINTAGTGALAWTFPPGWTQLSPGPVGAHRLGIAWKILAKDETLTGSISCTAPATSANGIASQIVLLRTADTFQSQTFPSALLDPDL